MTEVIRGTTGKTSANRVVMLGAAGLIGLTWLAVQAGVAFGDLEWSQFADAFHWGRDFVFVSVLPYLGNKAKETFQK